MIRMRCCGVGMIYNMLRVINSIGDMMLYVKANLQYLWKVYAQKQGVSET